MSEPANRRPGYGKRILLGLLCVVAIAAGAAFVPWPLGGYPSHPQPVASYEEAVQRAAAFDGADAALMNPVCKTQLMTHGHKTDDVIVLVHGYENCSEQFRELGTLFFDMGYNVLVATMPSHGLADRNTTALSNVTAAKLAAYGDEVVDIARGLGDRVSMAGLSAGGVVTAWAAQSRSDLHLAVLLDPAFGVKTVPTDFTVPTMNAASILPESYIWIDAELKEDFPPAWVYPRHSVHALAQLMRLGFAVQGAASKTRPGAEHILVITNGNDMSVNNDMTARVVAKWRAQGADVETYEFPASLGLDHDVIDPNRPEQQIDLVYPVVIGLMEKYK